MIGGLKPVDPEQILEYEKEMEEEIPEIVKCVQRRQALAEDARRRCLVVKESFSVDGK